MIVSDNLILPFESEIDYSTFSIFISERELEDAEFNILEYLRAIPKETREEMLLQLYEVRSKFVYNPGRVCSGDSMDMILRILERRALTLREVKPYLDRKRRYTSHDVVSSFSRPSQPVQQREHHNEIEKTSLSTSQQDRRRLPGSILNRKSPAIPETLEQLKRHAQEVKEKLLRADGRMLPQIN